MNFVCVNNASISALMLLLHTVREQKNASGRDGRDGHDPSYLLFVNTDGDVVDLDKINETRIVALKK